jgi:hypothetical protein
MSSKNINNNNLNSNINNNNFNSSNINKSNTNKYYLIPKDDISQEFIKKRKYKEIIEINEDEKEIIIQLSNDEEKKRK